MELAQRVALPVDLNFKAGGMFLRVCDLFFGWRAAVGHGARSLMLGNPVRTGFRYLESDRQTKCSNVRFRSFDHSVHNEVEWVGMRLGEGSGWKVVVEVGWKCRS